MAMKASIRRFHPDELRRDKNYSRSINERHVKRIMDAFEPTAVGVVVANQRKDGKLILIDGNHRVEAIKRLGKKDMLIEALVFEGMGLQDEARLFASINTQLAVSPLELWNAKLVGGDEKVLAINSVLVKFGYKVGYNTGGAYGGGAQTITSPKTITTVYDKGLLPMTLEVTARAWPKLERELPAVAIRAIAKVLYAYPVEIDRKELARRLSEKDPKVWVNEWRARAKAMGGQTNTTSAAYGAIIDLYNKHRSKGRLGKPKRGALKLVIRGQEEEQLTETIAATAVKR